MMVLVKPATVIQWHRQGLALATIYLEAPVLDHDQEAGCVEQPRALLGSSKRRRELRAHNLLFSHQIPAHKRERGGVARVHCDDDLTDCPRDRQMADRGEVSQVRGQYPAIWVCRDLQSETQNGNSGFDGRTK